ncbi:U11/U12 small nuclear ribonucleoprotein 25 kDa protein [Quillaja saponaria]|uniref:U11/U12 small nuclear ribonucleoprotein 25 kDa protein n=1 Tax=Quillaja saponaria TaxID=32244 RepID=A0AAD7PT61_QUISA|nr:U11/U12 small nuclear ribonucleoprotein 25 kDa protein [Quillaja saponaria]
MNDGRLTMEEDFETRVSIEKDRPSVEFPFSPLLIIDGILSRKNFSYAKLPSEPIRLSVLKLDGSCFDIEVAKKATIAELKLAVEAVFSHMPQKGQGKISWPHVWGQFCLSYDGQKLVAETDYLRNYGIKDGDQLHFIRHLSNSCNLRKLRLKKKVFGLKQRKMSLSRVNSYQERENSDIDDSGLCDIESGKLQHYDDDDDEGCTENHGHRLTQFLGEWLSYTKLGTVERTRVEGKTCASKIARGLLGSLRKIKKIVCLCRRKRYSRRDTLRIDS